AVHPRVRTEVGSAEERRGARERDGARTQERNPREAGGGPRVLLFAARAPGEADRGSQGQTPRRRPAAQAVRGAARRDARAGGRLQPGQDRRDGRECSRPHEEAARPMMAMERSGIQWGTTQIAYLIRRSTRRGTVSVAVEPSGQVVLTAPEATTVERLDRVV